MDGLLVFLKMLVGKDTSLGMVAQLVEQFAFNELVAGSIPAHPI